MHFTKMHGCGNDYVYCDITKGSEIADPGAASIYVSDRHFGIGSDGLILIAPSKTADFRMIMYNADGSEGAMCGNGIRCVGKFLYDHGMVNIKEKDEITIETLSGIKSLKAYTQDGEVTRLRVDMGKAVLNPKDIPVALDGDKVVNREVTIGGKVYNITCVSMGNPHAITFIDNNDEGENNGECKRSNQNCNR